jgi:hypothetical protein
MKNKETTNCGFDELIKLGKKEAFKKNNNEASLLILNPLGSMVLQELLELEDTIELPKTYKGLEIVYTQDQYAEVARVY